MDVLILEKDSGRQIGVFPVILGGSIGKTEKEFFDEAWRCAVDDGLVAPDGRNSYEFKLLQHGSVK